MFMCLCMFMCASVCARMCVCMCSYVCVCVFIYVSVCVHVCVCVPVELRGQCQVFFSITSLNLELTNSVTLAGPWAQGTRGCTQLFVCLSLKMFSTQYTLTIVLFYLPTPPRASTLHTYPNPCLLSLSLSNQTNPQSRKLERTKTIRPKIPKQSRRRQKPHTKAHRVHFALTKTPERAPCPSVVRLALNICHFIGRNWCPSPIRSVARGFLVRGGTLCYCFSVLGRGPAWPTPAGLVLTQLPLMCWEQLRTQACSQGFANWGVSTPSGSFSVSVTF